MKLSRIASVLVPPGSARGKVLHDYLFEPLALGLARKGFSHESRDLYAWSKARHVADRLPEEGYPRRLLDRASERLASVADGWAEYEAANNRTEDETNEPLIASPDGAEHPASHRYLVSDPNDPHQSAAGEQRASASSLRAAS